MPDPKDAERPHWNAVSIEWSVAKARDMRETIHGQGLSIAAMGKELREKDAIIASLIQDLAAARAAINEMSAAVRAVDEAWVKFSEHGVQDARLITVLYDRLDDLNVALAARDAAIMRTEDPPT